MPDLDAAGARSHSLAELEAALAPLVPALDRLCEAQREQRRHVVAGDLAALVAVNATLEAAGARIASLEQRRQAAQAELEATLGVQGLRAVLQAGVTDPSERARLGRLAGQIARRVREAREQGRQNAALLGAAIDLAHRTRAALERLSGAGATYDPVKARREQAARRVRASLAAARPVSAGRVAAALAAPLPAPSPDAPGEALGTPAPRTEAP